MNQISTIAYGHIGMASTRNHKNAPLVSKKAAFPFQVSIVCWIDLLGYGDMISQAGFNPLNPKAKTALQRLRQFHEIVSNHSARHFPTLVMNDGAAAYRDLSLRSRSSSYDFLCRAWGLFKELKTHESKCSYPGPRAVVACGFRMRGRRAGIDAANSQFRSILKRFELGKIDSNEALHEMASTRREFDIVPQLQANFAFTKAYVAEQSGSRKGLSGPNFYMDLALVEQHQELPTILGPSISWSHDRLNLQAKFAQLRDISSSRHQIDEPVGIRNGLEVAQFLANDPDVLATLRAAKK